jgi:hypothetical protein
MPQAAPRYYQDRPADQGKSFADAAIATTTSLQTISKFPPFGAQLVELHCAGTAGAVTVTLEDDTDFVVELNVGETRPVPLPVKAFKSRTGTGMSANCYWWSSPGLKDPQYLIPRNP